MSEDNWKHRSIEIKCKTCMWFALKKQNTKFAVQSADGNIRDVKPGEVVSVENYQPIQLSDSNIGRCRRHAPTINGYPVVYIIDWCGDHRLDENKI